jgi:hypothetical protein
VLAATTGLQNHRQPLAPQDCRQLNHNAWVAQPRHSHNTKQTGAPHMPFWLCCVDGAFRVSKGEHSSPRMLAPVSTRARRPPLHTHSQVEADTKEHEWLHWTVPC